MLQKTIRIVLIVCAFLTFSIAAKGQNQDCDCYSTTRAQGVQEMKKKQYAKAIEYFKAAEDCPDKPANNDLRAKREECQREIRRLEEQRQREEEEARRRERQERERELEIARKGFMDISRVTFGNVDKSGNILNDYGSVLYRDEVRYVKSKVYYTGLASESKSIELKMKILKPDGTLKSGSNSPAGYTWKENKIIFPGSSNTITLLGWGNDEGTSYSTGTYGFEIWSEEKRIYSTSFVIKEKAVAASWLTVDGDTSITTSFSASGGSEIFYVSTDASTWKTWGIPSWCTVTEKTATSFYLNCSANTSSSARKDYMKIKAGDKEVRIDITQSGFDSSDYSDLRRGEWRSLMKKVMENPTFTYGNGVYKGQANDYTESGIGVYRWNNGSYYWGKWDNGDRNGMGISIVSDDSRNVLNCPNCSYYVGYYSHDMKSGRGTCYDRDGNLIYYGDFSNDAPSETYPTTGDYSAYKFECIKYSDGSYFLGETMNGKRHGRGIYVWTSGSAWYGQWSEGSRKGYGLTIRYSGDLQYGKWEADTLVE